MFMRFRGGGVGHLYMRHVEPWLDATGWGTTWPSLRDREPADPQPEAPQRTDKGPAPTGIPEGGQRGESDDDDDDDEEEADAGELTDHDAEDLEQPEDSDNDDSDKDSDEGAEGNGLIRLGDGEDETEDEEEGYHL